MNKWSKYCHWIIVIFSTLFELLLPLNWLLLNSQSNPRCSKVGERCAYKRLSDLVKVVENETDRQTGLAKPVDPSLIPYTMVESRIDSTLHISFDYHKVKGSWCMLRKWHNEMGYTYDRKLLANLRYLDKRRDWFASLTSSRHAVKRQTFFLMASGSRLRSLYRPDYAIVLFSSAGRWNWTRFRLRRNNSFYHRLKAIPRLGIHPFLIHCFDNHSL